MKVLVVLLGLITTSLQSGDGAVTVRIRAYNDTGEMDIEAIRTHHKDSFTLGTRILLICDVEQLPMVSEVVSYKWEHNCTLSGGTKGKCEIREGDPYYRVVNDTLLVDVTSYDYGGTYYCFVNYNNMLQEGQASGNTPRITVTGNTVPFLYTPISLLPENSLITDVQQATGRNGQQWITCNSGRQSVKPLFWRQNKLMKSITRIIPSNSTPNSATIGLGEDFHHSNGLYYCFVSMMQYFSLYLMKSATLPTPTVCDQDSTMWTLTSPDGSQVERYIIQFECSLRNITFAVKYTSVSASGGTVRVAKRQSCFGVGQLYKLKVWSVSGPNISRQLAVKYLTPDGQCREEGSRGTTTSTGSDISPTIQGEPANSSTDHYKMQTNGDKSAIGTYIGVGVGVGVLLLLVLVILVGVILAVVVVRRKAVHKKNGDTKTVDNLYYNRTVVVKQGIAMREKGLDVADAGNSLVEEKSSIVDGFDTYEDADSKVRIKSMVKPAPKLPTTPASAANMEELYAAVDKTKKKGTKKKRDGGTAKGDRDDMYSMPMKKKGKMTADGEGVVESVGMNRGEEYDGTVVLNYEPMADSESGQQSEGDNKALNVDMLYAVVDKSHKKKK